MRELRPDEDITPELVCDLILDDNPGMNRESVRPVVDDILDRIDEIFPFKECLDCGDFIEGSSPECLNCGSRQVWPSFREYQHEITVEAAVALWIEDYDNVVIEAPTGVGKSPINFTLGHLSGGAFYTTPQKQLREQLADDEALQSGMKALRGRADYTCGETGKNCQECPVNQRDDQSCLEMPDCTYWNHKGRAMKSHIAALTFAYLIVDKYIPTYSQNNQISFANRPLGINDECHKLEGQVASLFAGYSVTPWSVPPDVWSGAHKKIERKANRGDGIHNVNDVLTILDRVAERANRYVKANEGNEALSSAVDDCESFLQKYDYMKEELKEGRTWVADTKEVTHPSSKKQVQGLQIKPVKVDRFLQRFVWSRADKWILSSATIPFRKTPERWLDRIGLQGDTKFISKPMPFPKENRPIHTDYMIDEFSGSGMYDSMDEIVTKIESITRDHTGDKGLVHTASYKRAQDLAERLPTGMAIVHDRDNTTKEQIREWQNSPAQLLLSPSMMEGVDLYDDICRFQILLKVPYPYMGDSRVKQLVQEEGQWDWYNQETALNLWQSVGRAVRSKSDHADYYVLDENWKKICSSTNPPEWILDAMV